MNSQKNQQELFEQALSLYSKYKYTEALEKFKEITDSSLLIMKYYYIGLCYVQLDRFEEALSSYKRIHEIPQSIQGVEFDRIMYSLYINMASVLQKLAKKHGEQYYIEAETCYSYALEINKTDERVWNNLGNVQLELRKYPEAIQSFKKAIKLNSEFPEPYYCLSLAYEFMGAYEKAIEYLKKELKWKSKSKIILNRLTGLLFGIGKFEEAKNYAEKMLEYYPDDKIGLKNLALIHYNLENYSISYDYYNRLISQYPDFDPQEADGIFADLKKKVER